MNTMSGRIPAIGPTTELVAAAIARRCSKVAMRKLITVIGVAVEKTRSIHDLLENLTFEEHPS